MKVFKRLAPIILLIVLLMQTLLTPAYGAWTASGGGNGNGGSVGTGSWSIKMLGLRITIIDEHGNPALTYGTNQNWTSTDVLYSTHRTEEVDISAGGCKALSNENFSFFNGSGEYVYGNNSKSLKDNLHSNITAFQWMRDTFQAEGTGEWQFAAPDFAGAYANFKQLANTYN